MLDTYMYVYGLYNKVYSMLVIWITVEGDVYSPPYVPGMFITCTNIYLLYVLHMEYMHGKSLGTSRYHINYCIF